jgi:hypothetical protein
MRCHRPFDNNAKMHYYLTRRLTHVAMAGHRAGHPASARLIEIIGSMAGYDAAYINSWSFHPLVLNGGDRRTRA